MLLAPIKQEKKRRANIKLEICWFVDNIISDKPVKKF